MTLVPIEEYCRNIYHSGVAWENDYGQIKRNVSVAVDQDFFCALCGREFIFANSMSARNPVFFTADMRESSIDHIVPLDCGGTNTKENLQLACKLCNRIKSNSKRDFKSLIESKIKRVTDELEIHAEYLELVPGHVKPRVIKLIDAFNFLLPEAIQVKVDVSNSIELIAFCKKMIG
jgi:hypothetical protein